IRFYLNINPNLLLINSVVYFVPVLKNHLISIIMKRPSVVYGEWMHST
uniref:Uncharacterized protein n=1 Tax=Sinocyclocheilus anshuiensis TaxID=1608454 RepID=A0A671KK91_9TELE